MLSRASCSLACRDFYEIISSSHFFFSSCKLCLQQGAASSGSQEQLHALALRRLARVGPALHCATLSGLSCSADVVARLPSLRSLALVGPAAEPCCWGQLAALPHLRCLSLGGVQLAGMQALQASSTLKVVTITVAGIGTGSGSSSHALQCPVGYAEQLAEGLPGLAAATKLTLHLPEYAEPLNGAVARLPQLASLSITTTHKPSGTGGGSSDGSSSGGPCVRPACWTLLGITQLMLNLAGDSTLVCPGLAQLGSMRRLSIVGSGERSPQDLFAGGGGYWLETLAVAGTGGLPAGGRHSLTGASPAGSA